MTVQSRVNSRGNHTSKLNALH